MSLLALVRAAQLAPVVEREPGDVAYAYRDEPERAVAADRLLELGYSEARIVRALQPPARQRERRAAIMLQLANAKLLRGLSPTMRRVLVAHASRRRGNAYAHESGPASTRHALRRRRLLSTLDLDGAEWFLTAAGWRVVDALRAIERTASRDSLTRDGTEP